MMKWLLNLREAVGALRANVLRSVLTTLGVIFGVAAVIVMVSIGTGTQRRIQEEIESLGVNTLQVFPGSQTSGRGRMRDRGVLTDEDAAAIGLEVPGLVGAAPLVRGRVSAIGGANWSTTGVGVTEAFFPARDWRPSSGRVFQPEEVELGLKVAVLGRTAADRLFPGGDAVDRSIRVNRLTFRVVGVLEPKGQTMDGSDLDDIVVMPLSTARNHLFGRRTGSANAVDTIVVKVSDGIDLGDAQATIRDVLRDRHRLAEGQDDDFRIQDMAEVSQVREASSSALTGLLAAVASISLLVGGIGIMNIMLVSVTERTREIGVRAAVGAAPADLMSQFLVEAVTLSLVGAAFGAALGVGGALVAEHAFEMRVALTLEPMLLAVSFAVVVGVVFGLYPAWKASRLSPIEALRFE